MNEMGYDSGNGGMTSGRTLPWLQDVDGVDVWTLWNVGFRDVVICDDENHFVDVYNLTEHDLGVSANREELKGILRSHATP